MYETILVSSGKKQVMAETEENTNNEILKNAANQSLTTALYCTIRMQIVSI